MTEIKTTEAWKFDRFLKVIIMLKKVLNLGGRQRRLFEYTNIFH